ncbi:hypothetical protein [Noviherbaspirillum pedocola]|uniref:Uncharacterized protein n=1 Tax=Noviherbaspirillum pedocola TaxID=2801341 RepID=A0A934WA04_9BURK|nr:hypothetical protein [Noviherbaspirillum pedocola]MBK4738988.1 hypothetical protein [Noviherbaspirillum pedocola]
MNGDQPGAEIDWTKFKPPVIAGSRDELSVVVACDQFGKSIHCRLGLLPLRVSIAAALL